MVTPRSKVILRRKVIPVLIGILLFLQIFSPAPPILYVLSSLVGVSAFSYYWARQLASYLSLIRERRYGWSQVGDVIEERFCLANDAPLPALWVQVQDHSTLPGYTASRVVAAEAHSEARWMTEGFCRQRGVFELGPLSIKTGDPFGIFTVSVEYPDHDLFTVYPLVSALPRLELPRGDTRGAGGFRRPTQELTTDAAAVREYTPGDSLNRIHWRATAHHDNIIVKEFDQRPSGDLWLILDLQQSAQLGQGEESTEEYAVILAASLSYRLLRQDRAVGLVSFDRRGTMVRPARSQAQVWNLLRALADVSADGERSLAEGLREVSAVLGRGMTAAIITPSLEPAWLAELLLLKRYGIAPMVILFDRESFGGQGNAHQVAGLLADYGIGSHIVPRGYQFTSLVPRRRQRPVYKVLATGRVVVVPPEQASSRELTEEAGA